MNGIDQQANGDVTRLTYRYRRAKGRGRSFWLALALSLELAAKLFLALASMACQKERMECLGSLSCAMKNR